LAVLRAASPRRFYGALTVNKETSYLSGSTAADGSITDVGTASDITDWASVFRAATKVDYYHFEYDLAPDPAASAANAYRFLTHVRFWTDHRAGVRFPHAGPPSAPHTPPRSDEAFRR
jgi:hypothetical protein